MSRILKLWTVDLDEISTMIRTGEIKTHQDLHMHIELAIQAIKEEQNLAFKMIDDIETCNEHIYNETLNRNKAKIKVKYLSTPYIYCDKCGKLKQ